MAHPLPPARGKSVKKTRSAKKTQKSPMAELQEIEAAGKLSSRQVLDTLIACLDKAILRSKNKTAARTAIAEGAAVPFTHNARVGTQNYALPVSAAQIRTTAQHNRARATEDAWSFTSAGMVIEDHVRNAAYDTITRILMRAWRCIDVPFPEPPIDSILERRPPYGHLREPTAWTGTPLADIVRKIEKDPLWEILKRGRWSVPADPKLPAFLGAPMVHFPLPRPREDIPAPPDYVLLCVVPSNAALAEAAGGWRSIFPNQVPPAILADLRAVLQAEMRTVTAEASRSHDAQATSRFQAISQIQEAVSRDPVSFETANTALREIRALFPPGSPLRETGERTADLLARSRRPRVRLVRLLNDQNTARNVSGVLSGRYRLPMIRTDLPIRGAWSPDRPVDFAPGPERTEILRDYIRLLRDRRKANLTYRSLLAEVLGRLMEHSFTPLEEAIFCRLTANDAPRGTIRELAALLDSTEPDAALRAACADAFAREILSEISSLDRRAVGNDAQAIGDDLERHARRHLDNLLSRHGRRAP